jgi:hypothetical protein
MYIQPILFRSIGLSGRHSYGVKTPRVKETCHAISLTANTNYLRLFSNIQLHYYENILASRGRVKHWALNVLNHHNRCLQWQTFLNSAYLAMAIIYLRCTATHKGDSASLNKRIMSHRGDIKLNKFSSGPGDYQDFLLHMLGKEPLG